MHGRHVIDVAAISCSQGRTIDNWVYLCMTCAELPPLAELSSTECQLLWNYLKNAEVHCARVEFHVILHDCTTSHAKHK